MSKRTDEALKNVSIPHLIIFINGNSDAKAEVTARCVRLHQTRRFKCFLEENLQHRTPANHFLN